MSKIDYQPPADLSGLGTAAFEDTGTSGHTLPFLDGANTWSALQTFSSRVVFGSQPDDTTARIQIYDSATDFIKIGSPSSGEFVSVVPSGTLSRLRLLQTGIADWNIANLASTGVLQISSALTQLHLGNGVIEHRNGANAQKWQVHRTWTDASNYERQAFQSGSGYFEWAAETAGTGTDNINLRLTPAGTGIVQFMGGTTSFPALKRSSAILQVRLADDSAYAALEAETLKLRTDVVLERDAAGVLALRNGVNANGQTIYNTYTDGSNYERAFVGWFLNEFQIQTQEAGSGSIRNLLLSAVGPLAKFEQLGGSLGGTRLTMTSEFPTVGAILESTSLGLCDLLLKGAATGSMNLRMEARTTDDFILAPEYQFGTAGDPSCVIGDAGGVMVRKGLLYFAGITSSEPALKRSSAKIQARLADDSGYADFDAKDLTLSGKISSVGDAVSSRTALGIPNDFVCQGRLTLETAVPISTTDQTAKTTIYWTPYKGNGVDLYNGTVWIRHSTAEVSIALGTLTADKNYDVFAYSNSGTLALELSAAWTNDSTRADALTQQDGVLVKSGATTRRYLGTFRTTTTTTTEDSAAKRFVWNMYNRVRRKLLKQESTDTWTYSTASHRQANGSAANQVAVVVGASEDLLEVDVRNVVTNSGTTARSVSVGIGISSATVNSADITAGGTCTSTISTSPMASLKTMPALGYSFYAWLEYGAGADTQTWRGDSGAPTISQMGITGITMT